MTTATKIFALLLLFSLASARDITNFPGLGERRQARFYGGTAVTDVNAHPSVVAVKYGTNGNEALLGQANIINKNFALTSGSITFTIIKYTNVYKFNVISNTLNVSTEASGLRHSISDVLSHPDYVTKPFTYAAPNDLGLIKVCPPFLTSTFAVLPQPGQLFAVGTPVVMVGWGYNSDILQEVHFVLDSAANCKITTVYTLSASPVREFDATKDLCIVTDINKSTCNGDYGEGMYSGSTIIGISSSYFPCGLPYADTQTSVAAYAQWIIDNSV